MVTGIRKLSKFCADMAELYSEACRKNFSICIADAREDEYTSESGGRFATWYLTFWIDDDQVGSAVLWEEDPAEVMQQILAVSHYYIMKNIMEKEEISWQKKT